MEDALREGRLRPGDRLPAVRTAAAELDVSPGTVAAAWKTLRARGIVIGAGRGGTRIAARPPVGTHPAPPVPAGVVNLADGNPDPALLPACGPFLRRLPDRSRLYGEPRGPRVGGLHDWTPT